MFLTSDQPAKGHQPETEVPRETVVGDGIALVRTRDGRSRLYALDAGAPRCIGTFTDAGAAWAALDRLDEAA